MRDLRDPERTITIAVLQAGTDHSQNGNPGAEANFDLLASLAHQAVSASPDLIVFPEYAISGWPYPPERDINGLAESVPGEGQWYRRYVTLAQETGVAIMGWLVEQDGLALYNTAFLVAPDGTFVGRYRKVHANLGEQTWWGWSQGDAFAPIEYGGVRYGNSICADMWFPETVRCNELLDADLVIHQSIADDMGHLIPARAFDSEIPIVAAIFTGGSYAVDSRGQLLGKLSAELPGWNAFDIRPFQVQTHRKYGGHWIPKLGQRNLRNVRAYGVLVDPATRPPWTQVFLDDGGAPQTRDQLLRRFHGRYDANDPAPCREPLVAFAPPWRSPFTVSPDWPFQLVNREGEHIFIVNKTAWAYFGCRDPVAFVDRARHQGVNVIRVALEGTPYADVLGIDLWPWGGTRSQPDWSTFNESYWKQVEKRVQLAGERGIGLDLVLYFNLHPSVHEVDTQRAYWMYVLHRLGRYANILTWEIANEYTANEAFQDQVGLFFKHHDPYRRPVCTSDGTTDDAVWPDKAWMDLAINHSCTSSTEHHPLREWYLSLAMNSRAHGKPAFCNESGREKRHKNDDGIHRRKQGWLWSASGGFWTWHSWDGCEGINDLEYRAPGEQFVKSMADFFRSIPFWSMSPNYTACTIPDRDLIAATLAEPDRLTTVSYVCTPQSLPKVPQAPAVLRLPDGQYEIMFVSPADSSVLGTQTHTSYGLRQQTELVLPQFVDDLAILINRKAQHIRTQIPGTL